MKPYMAVALLYGVFSAAWILMSDQITAMLFTQIDNVTLAQSLKGLLFVGCSTLLVLLVSRYYYLQMESARQQQEKIFTSTMDTVTRLMNNFLNDMIWFRIAAEENGALDHASLQEYDRLIAEASRQLARLSRLDDIDPARIRASLEDGDHVPDPTVGNRLVRQLSAQIDELVD